MTITVSLFDVDNTLLDNDSVQADLGAHLAQCYGDAVRDRFWEIFEELRTELGYAVWGHWSATGLRRCTIPVAAHGQLAGGLSIPGASLSKRDRGRERGPTIRRDGLLSDGDAVFQPRKVERSGLWSVFGDNVLIYVHKELELPDVEDHCQRATTS